MSDYEQEIQSQIESEAAVLFADSICEHFNNLISEMYKRGEIYETIYSMKMVISSENDGSESYYCLKVVAEDTSDSYDPMRVKTIQEIMPPGMSKYIGFYSIDIEHV